MFRLKAATRTKATPGITSYLKLSGRPENLKSYLKHLLQPTGKNKPKMGRVSPKTKQ